LRSGKLAAGQIAERHGVGDAVKGPRPVSKQVRDEITISDSQKQKKM
jgi:hypothetical protein